MTVLAKDAAELSLKKTGHWRNKYWSEGGWTDCDPDAIKIDAYTCILSDQYLSEADAEREGREMVRRSSDPNDRWHDQGSQLIFLGPVFFPEGAPTPPPNPTPGEA